jgi:hypothetical protein
MFAICSVGLGKNEGIRLHVRMPNTFSISLLSFNDAICVGEGNFLEPGQASKFGGGGGASSSNLMALASTLSLEDLIAKCSMDISKLKKT